ncbi:hypothetical protein CYMTET_41249 [Cymbomonas tetramitiformis]|uniref:Uncharacterized protein n=1 Tax=Cymbomonas tetramitiformis TaxID=36881 RepID=A0AAE0C7U5_9CHLO|nr:hypothetical protein CYMTET_41249 [Cymbomonas tetramitiformis]
MKVYQHSYSHIPSVQERCLVCANDHDGSHTTEDGDKTVCPRCGVVGTQLVFGEEYNTPRLDGRFEDTSTEIKLVAHRNANKRSRLNVQQNVMRAEDSNSYVLNGVLHFFGEAFDRLYSNAYKTHYIIYHNGKKNSDSSLLDQELGIQHFWKVLLFVDHTSNVAYRDSKNTNSIDDIAKEKFLRLVPVNNGRLCINQGACDIFQTFARFKLCALIGDMGGVFGGSNGTELEMAHIARLPLLMCVKNDCPLANLGIVHFVVEKCEAEWCSVRETLLQEYAATDRTAKCFKRITGHVKESGSYKYSAEDDYAGDARVHFKRLEIGKKTWINVLNTHLRARNPKAYKDLTAFVIAAYGEQISRKKWKKAAKIFGGLFAVLEQHL